MIQKLLLYLYYNVNAFYIVLFKATEIHVFTEWAKKKKMLTDKRDVGPLKGNVDH